MRMGLRGNTQGNSVKENWRHVLDGNCEIAQYKHLQTNSRDSHESKTHKIQFANK